MWTEIRRRVQPTNRAEPERQIHVETAPLVASSRQARPESLTPAVVPESPANVAPESSTDRNIGLNLGAALTVVAAILYAISRQWWITAWAICMTLGVAFQEEYADLVSAVFRLTSPLKIRKEKLRVKQERREHIELQRKIAAEERAEREREAGQQSAERRSSWWGRYSAYLRSPEWKQVRGRVIRRDGKTCQHCGGRATQVHHTKYTKAHRQGDFRKQPTRNLIALCKSCHEKAHGR